MNTQQKSITARIAELRQALPIALKERRRQFLQACGYYMIALEGSSKTEIVLSEEDEQAFDLALDRFTAAAKMVLEIQTEITDKEHVVEFAAERGIEL